MTSLSHQEPDVKFAVVKVGVLVQYYRLYSKELYSTVLVPSIL